LPDEELVAEKISKNKRATSHGISIDYEPAVHAEGLN